MARDDNFFISLRTPDPERDDAFQSLITPKPALYLRVPFEADPHLQKPDYPSTRPSQAVDIEQWITDLMEASRGPNGEGNILLFVHGFNNNPPIVNRQHHLLRHGLERVVAPRWHGAVVSFDWPAAHGYSYLEDRKNAFFSAGRFMSDVLAEFCTRKRPDCNIHLHILARSMGCYLVRHAFTLADDTPETSHVNWSVSQTIFLNADVSARSMEAGDPRSESLYRHTQRLTNYCSRYDAILKLSRIMIPFHDPRIGRVGLPDAVPAKAVDVDMSDRWVAVQNAEGIPKDIFVSHYWSLFDDYFYQDLAHTLVGDLDRTVIPTRRKKADGHLALKTPAEATAFALAKPIAEPQQSAAPA